MTPTPHHGAVLAAGILLGVGLGGFIDGILLHQLLQWHNMLSSVVPPVDLLSVKYNMLWDGIFHAGTWLITALGVALLWRAGGKPDVPRSTPALVGALALGWGAFNLVEGVIDHQILGLHHVHPGENQLAWDLGFLAFGGLLLILGGVLVRAAWQRQPSRRDARHARVAAPPPSTRHA